MAASRTPSTHVARFVAGYEPDFEDACRDERVESRLYGGDLREVRIYGERRAQWSLWRGRATLIVRPTLTSPSYGCARST